MPYTTVTALWEGTTGLPGYTKMKWNSELPSSDATLAANKMQAFFTAVDAFLSSDITISWDGVYQTFTDEQVLDGEGTYTPPAPVKGGSAASYASPVGAVIDWLTNDFFNGRRLRGRTFLVPLVMTAFDTDGTLTSACTSVLNTAATNIIAGDPLLVINGAGTKNSDGSPGPRQTKVVAGGRVPDRAAILRSRRD